MWCFRFFWTLSGKKLLQSRQTMPCFDLKSEQDQASDCFSSIPLNPNAPLSEPLRDEINEEEGH